MSGKRKRASSAANGQAKRGSDATKTCDVVWRQSAEEATLAKKPHYNGFACGHGAHGDRKYNRAKAKQAWRKQIRHEGASQGPFPFAARTDHLHTSNAHTPTQARGTGTHLRPPVPDRSRRSRPHRTSPVSQSPKPSRSAPKHKKRPPSITRRAMIPWCPLEDSNLRFQPEKPASLAARRRGRAYASTPRPDGRRSSAG